MRRSSKMGYALLSLILLVAIALTVGVANRKRETERITTIWYLQASPDQRHIALGALWSLGYFKITEKARDRQASEAELIINCGVSDCNVEVVGAVTRKLNVPLETLSPTWLRRLLVEQGF